MPFLLYTLLSPLFSSSLLFSFFSHFLRLSPLSSFPFSPIFSLSQPVAQITNPETHKTNRSKPRNPQITNPQTLVVIEEWLGYIDSDPKPNNIHFASIPNVVPLERLKAIDFPGFYEAAMIKMEAPFEQLLDRLEPSVDAILGDVELM